MSARFEVGMNVVCVDDVPKVGWVRERLEFGWVVAGRVYTIEEFSFATNGTLLLCLAEFPFATSSFTGRRGGFSHDRFRPCQRTDISELVKLVVNPPKEKTREHAL